MQPSAALRPFPLRFKGWVIPLSLHLLPSAFARRRSALIEKQCRANQGKAKGASHEEQYTERIQPSQTFPRPPKPQTAKEVIAANVQLLIEQLEAGHSEGLTAYLTAMGRFHSYSFGNILEIARQKPDATRVAGLYAWNKLGRKVKKGERGIRILAPVIGIRRKKEEEAEKDIRKQNHPVLVGFRAAYVFDVSQTEGAELPGFNERVKGECGRVPRTPDRLHHCVRASSLSSRKASLPRWA